MNILYIDIETTAGEEKPLPEEIKAPANYKDVAKIREYQEAHVDEVWRKQALDSMKGRIICACYALNHGDVCTSTGSEDDILYDLERAAEGWAITWCGWNIQSFDIPWIWRKSIKYGYHRLRDACQRESKTGIIDLMKLWASDYRDYVSLDECAQFLGFPAKEIEGKDVFGLWQMGDIDAIAHHCREDVALVRKIYEKLLMTPFRPVRLTPPPGGVL